MYLLSSKSKSLNDVSSSNTAFFTSSNSKSLNDVSSLNTTIFTCKPPTSYGDFVMSKEFTSKKLRCFVIKRFYNMVKTRNTN